MWSSFTIASSDAPAIVRDRLAAARARLREREQALRLGDDAAAVALRADDGSRSGLGAGASALRARDRQLDRNLRLGAAQRVLEREMDLRLAGACTTGVWGALAEDDRRALHRAWQRHRQHQTTPDPEGGPTP